MLEAGTKLGGYTIQKMVGRGGMGEVYLADDAVLDRPVAIKTIVAADAGLVARFQREARSVARLSHQNIVQVDLACPLPHLRRVMVRLLGVGCDSGPVKLCL